MSRARLDAEACGAARAALMRGDPVLRGVIERVGPCALRAPGAPYRFLVRAILRQQIADAAARSIERRFHASFGGGLPAPEVLAAARTARLRSAGLSRQKATAVRAVARAFRDGQVPRRLAALDDDAVIATVTEIQCCGSSSVISSHAAFEATKMCSRGRMPGSSSSAPIGTTASFRSGSMRGSLPPQTRQKDCVKRSASGILYETSSSRRA